MSTQDESKGAQGRKFDQVTKDGTSSAGSMGAGGTGNIGRINIGRMSGDGGNSGDTGAGNAQSATRTDDWLSRGPEQERDLEREQGFRPSDPDAIKTGMEGIAGAGKKP